MTTFLEFMPVISAIIFAGLLGISLWQFSTVRRNMRAQTEQQIYASILQLRTKLEDTDCLYKYDQREQPISRTICIS